MCVLNDDVMLIILKQLNRRERSNVRLVCKRFKVLCDFIKFNDKLIIFDRMPPVIGRLKYTNEPYSLDDCVYVSDLERFWLAHADCLKFVKKLVIYSVNKRYGFEIKTLDQLEHLELYNITFKTASLVESPKLVNIYCLKAFFNQEQVKLTSNKFNNLTVPKETFLAIANQLNHVDYLEVNHPFDLASLFTLGYDLRMVKRLRFVPMKLSVVLKVINHNLFKNVKRVDCFVDNNYNYNLEFDNPLSTYALERFRESISEREQNLDVYFCGINPVKASFEFLTNFYEEFKDSIKFCYPSSILFANEDILTLLLSYDQVHLIELYKLIHILCLIDLPVNERIYKKLVNITYLIVTLKSDDMTNFKTVLNYWPELVSFKFCQVTWNRIRDYQLRFDSLVEFSCLTRLKIVCWQLVDLKFLIEMKSIKYLVLVLYKPFENDLLLTLLRSLRYLAFVQITFLKPETTHSEEELSKLKDD